MLLGAKPFFGLSCKRGETFNHHGPSKNAVEASIGTGCFGFLCERSASAGLQELMPDALETLSEKALAQPITSSSQPGLQSNSGTTLLQSSTPNRVKQTIKWPFDRGTVPYYPSSAHV